MPGAVLGKPDRGDLDCSCLSFCFCSSDVPAPQSWKPKSSPRPRSFRGGFGGSFSRRGARRQARHGAGQGDHRRAACAARLFIGVRLVAPPPFRRCRQARTSMRTRVMPEDASGHALNPRCRERRVLGVRPARKRRVDALPRWHRPSRVVRAGNPYRHRLSPSLRVTRFKRSPATS